ncbi:MAG: GyrI-like domain-containing protein [Anaerolineae bacterium]
MNARIEEMGAVTLVGYRRTGGFEGHEWVPLFWKEFFEQGLHERLWNLPLRTAPGGTFSPMTDVDIAGRQFTYWIAVAYPADAPVPEGMGTTKLTPGTFAVLSVVSEPPAIQAGWGELDTWMQNAGYQHMPDGQCFEYYVDEHTCEIWEQILTKG